MPPAPIPLFDLQRQHDSLRTQLNAASMDALNSMPCLLGPQTQYFEKEFASLLGVKHCISCASGACAIQLALLAAGIQKGDEVITSPFGFIAATAAISLTGATFIFADIDPLTYTLDPKDIERKITAKTKAILPLHLYGTPADMTAIMSLAQKYGLKVMEDCSQSLLATAAGANTGTLGQAGVFSFYPSRILGACTDAGAITTNDDELALQCLRLRNAEEMPPSYQNEEGTENPLRMDEMQAALLRAKLKHLPYWTQARRRLAACYQEKLKGLPVRTPVATQERNPSYCLYTVAVPDRDSLQQYLKEKGVCTAVYYPTPLYRQPAYKHLPYKAKAFPSAEKACQEVLSLPMFPELTEQEVSYICEQIRKFYK